MGAWMDVAGGTTAVPSDGRGGVRTTAVSTFTAATIYNPTGDATAGAWPIGAFVGSANTNTIDAAWGGGALTPTVGDVIFDNQGSVIVAWGCITKITADAVAAGGTTYDIIEVDGWHKWGYPGSTVMPTAGDDMGLFRMIGAKCQRWIIDSIESRTNAAGTVTINDLAGTAVKTITVAAGSGYVFGTTAPRANAAQGESGWEINSPFTVTTAANLAVTINFRMMDNR